MLCRDLCNRSAELDESVHLLAEAIQSPRMLKHQLQVFEYFNVLFAGGTVRRKQFLVNVPSQRLCLSLHILDGRVAWASYRDIAIALFGPDRVNEDWNGPGDHFKNRIRRAAQRGSFLMQGGYLALLK